MTRRRLRPQGARTAVALLRVSKDERTQELGLSAQRAAVEAWAAREGAEVVAWHVEEVSGGAPLEKRTKLAAALADVEAHGASYLVALKVDRFSRDRIETGAVELALRRAGAQLVFADGIANGTDPTAEFMRTILLGAAQLERATIAKRIKDALAVKQSRGEMTGAPPYGFRAVDGPVRQRRDGTIKPVKVLEPDAAEQATIARARELSAGGASVRATIAALTSEGRLSRAGKPFTVAAMHKILASAPAENKAT